MHLLPNIVIHQKYQLEIRLSSNPSRQTWIVKDIQADPVRRYVLKLLTFNSELYWHNLRLFQREACTLRNLSHPCIPRYIDYFSIESTNFSFGLVQDYIPAPSLKSLVESGRKFSEGEIRSIALNLLSILTYLHELIPLVLHRDIKPSNILLDEDNQTYLVDFGSVQASAIPQEKSFTIVGTYGYTPIEQFGGQAVPGSDLYSLGATLIFLLTGITPSHLPQKNMRVQFRQFVNNTSDFVRWLEILTSPSVEGRFVSARQAANYLQKSHIERVTYVSNRPPSSRTDILKLVSETYIKVPERGVKFENIPTIILVLLSYLSTVPFAMIAFPFVVLYWIMGLIPFFFILIPIFSKVELRLKMKEILISWKLFGICFHEIREEKVLVQQIDEGKSKLGKLNGGSLMTVDIQTRRATYQFGGVFAPLSAAERQWIIEELNDWLNSG